MPNLAVVSLATGSGKSLIPTAPIVSHGPTAGTFVIDNYDASLRYVITNGTISGNTITLGTGSTISSTITAFTQRGVVASSGKFMERREITYSYVQVGTQPGSCSYLPASCNCCSNPSGGLCIFCSGGGPIYDWVKDGTPSGYTESYGEWWRIV